MSSDTGPDWSLWRNRDLVPAAADRISYRTGTHRVATPEHTWAAISPLLPDAGITRVADVTWLDDLGIPTAQAIRPDSMTLSVSQGKAPTLTGARVSAAMESLEGWHAENVHADLSERTAHELDDADELSYDPATLNHMPGSVYHRDTRLPWVRATTLLTGRSTWVPLQAVRVNVRARDRWSPPMFSMDTNGLASGNTFDEAALHGLYEVLERDSSFPGTTGGRVTIDPSTVTDAGCVLLIERMTDAGNTILITDLTRWPGYPCFTVSLRSLGLGGRFSGCGLHHDPAVALSRALTEAAQSRLAVISGAREDLPDAAYDQFGKPAGGTSAPAGSLTPFPNLADNAAAGDASVRQHLVRAAAAVTARTGIEPLGAVLEFPDANVPVVKVLAPGLRFAGKSDIRVSLTEDPS